MDWERRIPKCASRRTDDEPVATVDRDRGVNRKQGNGRTGSEDAPSASGPGMETPGGSGQEGGTDDEWAACR